jgi:hypothetical protein
LYSILYPQGDVSSKDIANTYGHYSRKKLSLGLGLSYSNYDSDNNDWYRHWCFTPVGLARVLNELELDSIF